MSDLRQQLKKKLDVLHFSENIYIFQNGILSLSRSNPMSLRHYFFKHLATLPCSLSPLPATGPSILWLPSLNNTSVTQDYHSYGRKNMWLPALNNTSAT